MTNTVTSVYHPNSNREVKRVNHTMPQVLMVVVNKRKTDWDAYLPHVEFADNNFVNAATGLAPNEVHGNRRPPAALSPPSNTITPEATKASPATI